jgi:NADH-quinone oxidoreductase subunit G
VWFLRSARTVCTGCATGCSAYLDYDPRTMTPHRHRPRENMAVNQYWMCDEGMLSYSRVTEGRLLDPRVGGKPASVESALAEAKRRFAGVPKESIAVVLSAQHSNEDNFALLELAGTFIGTTDLFVSGKPKGKRDEILIHEDKNPNTAGLKKLAVTARPVQELLERILGGSSTHVIALGSDLPGPAELLEAPLSKLAGLVTIASHDGPLVRRAHVALPACTWAEAEGTYVNSRGMAQKSERAIDPKGASQPAWQLVSLLGEALGYATGWKKLKEVRKAMDPSAVASAQPAGI